jgi:hypothetical protein
LAIPILVRAAISVAASGRLRYTAGVSTGRRGFITCGRGSGFTGARHRRSRAVDTIAAITGKLGTGYSKRGAE